MDPITAALVMALAGGVAAGTTEVGKQLIPDAYNALKAALQKKFGVDSDVVEAVEGLEKKPDLQGRAETLAEEITAVGADKDAELLDLAQTLQQAVQENGPGYQANLTGTGAIAQGEGASAASASGAGSIAFGSVGGDVNLGQPDEQHKDQADD